MTTSSTTPRWLKILYRVLIVWAVLFVLFLVAGAKADAAGCPDYVLVGNPYNGGTEIVDRCVYGTLVSQSDSVDSSATSASSLGSCRTVTHRVNSRNGVGWTLFWVQLRKYWCWRSSKITYAPTTSFSHAVTSFGSVMQWRDNGQTDKGTNNRPDGWLSQSWGTAHFERCLPTPFGCFVVGDASKTSWITAFGNGSYSY